MEIVPPGQDAQALHPGDLIFCHRNGLSSRIIRLGESLRGHSDWSHVAVVETHTGGLIEALTTAVVRDNISKYHDIKYGVVRIPFSDDDQAQAVCFAQSCVGQEYGWPTIFGIVLRYLTPGRGLWFGMNGTEICSGMAAQGLVRGWYNFKQNPASITPTELANEVSKTTKVHPRG